MHLTRSEERTLAGEEGPSRQKAMELLVALGDIYDAERLIGVASAQVSGASFKTIGDAGIQWLEDMAASAKATVPAMINPLGMDMRSWKSMGVEPDFRSKQLRIVSAYLSMGLLPVYSCTPYLAGYRPRKGQHVAWAESSATVFANSVVGARTNREGGPSALAAAIVGKTPEYGLHLDRNRLPEVLVRFTGVSGEHAALAGYLTGRAVGNRVPMVTGIKMTVDQHKSFGAAIAATGAVSMYVHDRGHARTGQTNHAYREVIDFEASNAERCAEELSGEDDWDLVAIGCPHCSAAELKTMARRLKGKRPNRRCDVWFCTSRKAYAQCPEAISVLQKFGKVLCDTCMVVAPIERLYERTATDSGKAAVYLPTLGKQKMSYRLNEQLLEAISR